MAASAAGLNEFMAGHPRGVSWMCSDILEQETPTRSTVRNSTACTKGRSSHPMPAVLPANASLGHSVRDADGGFALAPMRKGVRLTTVSSSLIATASPSPVQLARDEPLARELFPLTERLEIG